MDDRMEEIAQVSEEIGVSQITPGVEESSAARRELISRLERLTNKAERGDQPAALEARNILKENPDLTWEVMRKPVEYVEYRLLLQIMGPGLNSPHEVIHGHLDAMREQISGDDPSPLERLLAERVVMTWLQIQAFEFTDFSNAPKVSSSKAAYYHKRLEKAHRQHLSAIKTLAQIRKMGPAIQINVAEQQINTAG